MQPACEAYDRAYTLPLASPTATAPHARCVRTHARHIQRLICAYAYICIMHMHIRMRICTHVRHACECACLDLGWPYQHPRAWNAQVSQCICHVGLSWNWGSIANGLTPAVVRSGMCPADRVRTRSSSPHIQERGNLSPALARTPCHAQATRLILLSYIQYVLYCYLSRGGP